MGLFDGQKRIEEIIRQGGSLERWYSNSGVPLMKAIEKALVRDGKDVVTKMGDNGKLILEYFMYHNYEALKVIIMEDEHLGPCFNTLYPVETRHLTSNDIECILQAANANCKTGIVIHNESVDTFCYIFAYETNEFVPEGISVDILLWMANEETNNVLDYLDTLRECFNLYT